MYNQESIDAVYAQYRKFLNRFIAATVAFVIVLVLVCFNWGTKVEPYRLPVAIGYVVGVLYAIGAVFSWSLIGGRLLKYYKFVRDMVTGLDREVAGVVQRVSENPVEDNDLEFYQVEIKPNEEEENRLIYLDASKDISLIKEGADMKLLTHGKYIKEVLA